ncbi:MAG: CAP domain-containing protein [Candidatus Paceibacterota bacterium]
MPRIPQNKARTTRADRLRKAAIFSMTLMVMLSFAAANFQSVFWISSEWMVSTILPAVIVTETNKEREQSSLTPLVRSSTLDEAAALKAAHMAENEYFAHFSPDGTSPWHWFDESGYEFVHAGENLAVYFTDSSEIVDAWMGSPTHRANILDHKYQEIGIGIAQGEYEGYQTVYVVQLFGTPVAGSATARATGNADVSAAPEQTDTSPVVAGITDTTPSVSEPQVEMEGDTVKLSLVHMATTREGTPRPAVEAGVYDSSSEPSSLSALLTQPRVALQIIYIGLAIFVCFALLYSLLAEVRQRQPRDIAFGIGLLAVMLLLFKVHIAITSGGTII